MNTKEAINYLDIIKKSFDTNTAPRFSKETIEQERARATEALNLAIKLLERGKAMNYGTAYGLEPKVWKLGREALALVECDKLDEREGE